MTEKKGQVLFVDELMDRTAIYVLDRVEKELPAAIGEEVHDTLLLEVRSRLSALRADLMKHLPTELTDEV